MNRIILYSDLQKTYTDYSDIIVEKIEDYVDAYIAILVAIYNKLPLIVVVRNQYCLNYFKKMQERYSEQITLKLNSPSKRFQELTGIDLPDYISEEDVVNDKLNQKVGEITFNIGMDFADNILNHYLGNYFINSHFPFSKLVDFLKRIDLDLLSTLKDNIILNKVYKVRMKLWQKNCHENYQVEIFNAYLESPKILLNNVAAYLMLKNYPKSLAKDIIGELNKSFEKIRLKEEAFIPIGMDTLDIQRNIRILLNQKTISGLTYDDIVQEIECLSGLFNEELQFVYSVLRQNRSVVDALILHNVRRKFKTGTQLDSMYDEKLNNMVPPAEVVSPENLATLNEWISWATASYLPYKFWMEANDVCDTKIDNYSTMYGDWIFNNYDSIISGEKSMLHRIMANLSLYFKEDELSFLVIIDNFNYKFAPLCQDYLSSKGFSTTLDQPMISMIPTETSVSKTAIFSGQPFNTEFKSYETMSKEWESLLGGDVQYLSDIGKLDAIHEKTAKLYILNYLSIDKILHEKQNNSALPISFRIQEELKAMMDKLVNFSKRLGFENIIKVYFTSDHGSTKISKEQMNLIDSKYYKLKAEDCAYRFIALPDKKFDIYKDSIGHLCYVLDRNSYGIRENYLIAKGYNRFMATDLSFYVHGGITPEENIVPLLKFERVNVMLIQPEMLLRNIEFRYSTTSTIKLTIKNHNEYALDKINIIIHNPNILWEQGAYRLQIIEKESQIDIYLEKVRILKSSSQDNKLLIKISFFFLGKEYEQDHEFPIIMKSAQETTVDLNELF